MEGRIISFDPHNQKELIRTNSGEIYEFNAYNYHTLLPIFVGAITSFEVNEDSSEIHSLYAVLPARYVKIVTNKKVDL